MKELSFFVIFLLFCSLFPVIEAGDVAPYAISADEAWSQDVTGKGVNIAILSTGIDNDHPGLAGKFIAGYDAVCLDDPLCVASEQPDDGSFDPDDTNQQGTAVAGMATSTGLLSDETQTNFSGSAPDTKLIDVRVASHFGAGPFGTYILEQEFYESAMNGLQWVIDNKDTEWENVSAEYFGIDILLVPFGIFSHEDGGSDGTDMFSQILDEAAEAGIVVVVSAGNSGSDNEGFSGMAASSLAITVGAIDDKNTVSRDDDGIASYSSRGPRRDNGDNNSYDELKPDVVAPGANIVQAEACTDFPRCDASGNGYTGRGSGTGYAAAYVAGVAALLLEKYEKFDLTITPSKVKSILQNSADRKETLSSSDGEGVEDGQWATYPDIDSKWNRHFGYGVVNASLNFDLTERPTATIDFVSTPVQFLLEEVIFEGTGFDSDGDIIAYHWESSIDGFLSNESNFISNYHLSVGHHIISFSVLDDSGYWSQDVHAQIIVYALPVADAGDDAVIEVGTTLELLGRGFALGNSYMLKEWDFNGDGIYDWSCEYGANCDSAIYTYNKTGSFTVSLRVTGDYEQIATDSFVLTVSAREDMGNNIVNDSSYPFGIPALSILVSVGTLLVIAIRRRLL